MLFLVKPFGRAVLALGVLPALAALTACTADNPPPPAPSSPTLNAVSQRGELRVCSTGDYRPFTYRDPSGAWSGIDVAMAADLAQRLHVRETLVPTTWDRISADLGSHCDIAVGGVSVTPQRAAVGEFSDPVLADGKTPIARCDQAARFGDLAAIDQPGVRVAVNPGGTNEKFVNGRLHQATIVPFPDNNEIFGEIVAGRANVMITDASETRWQSRRDPRLCPVHPDQPFTHSQKAYLLPKGDAVWRDRVDLWLRDARSDGTFARASAPWTG